MGEVFTPGDGVGVDQDRRGQAAAAPAVAPEAEAVKERPILFSGEMVRAILDGRKTQTRRVIKPQPYGPDGQGEHFWSCKAVGMSVSVEAELQNKSGMWGGFAGTVCPYGEPGDQLWVRETFQPILREGVYWRDACWETGKGYQPVYPATDEIVEHFDPDDNLTDRCKPSIHMPRWASRINLRVTGVRVERVQDISEADALAEGCKAMPGWKTRTFAESDAGKPMRPHCAADHFAGLWDCINSKRGFGWVENPWVWVVEFERVE